ncbi:MAG: phosphate acyltransferase PlsX [Ruminococcaceae bacterium]|nr:phosphate acyltransferase PlsX [Oscillospiraceae bacterium]
MNIIVDAFGGDEGVAEVVKGCVEASNDFDVTVTLVGDEQILSQALSGYENTQNIRIVHADEVIDNSDDPVTAIRRKKNASMVVGLHMLKDGEGDGFVSAGNTGALLAGATLIVGRLKGIDRPALAPFLPKNDGLFMLLDAGANTNCKPLNLAQFAILANAYVRRVVGVESPKVYLLNNGAEEGKGDALRKETFPLLQKLPLHFCGNVEARELPYADADIVVADGFTGNVVLKLYEGLGLYFGRQIKGMFMKNLFSKLAALTMKGSIREFKDKMDYTEYGGAPLLGVKKPVFKTHGSSKSKEFYYTIEKVKRFAENNVLDEVVDCIAQIGVMDHE